MPSPKQIEANRRNAFNSTGPKTEAGKKRSRRNAVRHGLTAETVIEVLEDPEDYGVFEATVTSEFDAQTAVERELVLRLASVLWRLRRSTAIETGLLQIQGEILREVRQSHRSRFQPPECKCNGMTRPKEPIPGLQCKGGQSACQHDHERALTNNDQNLSEYVPQSPHNIHSEIARCFLRLTNVDNGAFERVGRYETALWRQVGQILLMLDMLRRKNLDGRPRPVSLRSRYLRSWSISNT
jgi:hypothetical protein